MSIKKSKLGRNIDRKPISQKQQIYIAWGQMKCFGCCPSIILNHFLQCDCVFAFGFIAYGLCWEWCLHCLHYASTLATMSVLYKSSFLLFSTTVIEFCLCLFNIIRCWVEICKYCLLLLEFVHLHSFAKSLWRLGGLGNQWGVPIMQYFKSDLRLVWVNEWDTSVLFISLGRSACM